MANREKWAAYGAWAAVCFFWGTTYLAIRVGLETMTPMLFAGLRFLIAGGVLFFVMSRQRNARLPKGREWLHLAFVGLLLLGVGNGAVVWAEQWVPSGMASLLVATSPFWVVALEKFRKDGERVGVRGVVGMLVGFAGLGLLLAPQLFDASVSAYLLLGALAIQVGCLTWTGGSVYAKHRPVGVAPLMGAAVQMLIAGAVLTLFGTFLGEWGAMQFQRAERGGARVPRRVRLNRGLQRLHVRAAKAAAVARLDLLVHQPRDRGAARLARARRSRSTGAWARRRRSSSRAWRW